MTNPPENADEYRFDAVAVKEPRFEIDGVFLPPENNSPGVVYFCEVQFQKDENLYERVFAESHLYFYRNRPRFNDWQAVIIYPSRSIEQSDTHAHRTLLNGEQVHRVYLDELGDIRSLPLWVATMVLTTVQEELAPQEARYLLNRTRTELSPSDSRAIIEIITTIIAYRFDQLSRVEVEAMLDITLKETRVYREIKQEGREEGQEEGRKAMANTIAQQLRKRLGELPQQVRAEILGLSLSMLAELGEALLDFTSVADLQAWLEAQIDN